MTSTWRSKDGQITLAGSVGAFFDRAEAFDVASRIAGVTNIVDQLQVRDQVIPYVYSVWLDPYDPFVEDWYLRTPRSDAAMNAALAVASRRSYTNPASSVPWRGTGRPRDTLGGGLQSDAAARGNHSDTGAPLISYRSCN
ncbi:MAG TPA: BON domain-containing protein [Polyangiaceae bacterium]|nr:BON domain-containing protein [Polyangiaceae bacterium]